MLDSSIRDKYTRWRVSQLLEEHPELRITPSRGDSIRITGVVSFHLQGPIGDPINDEYEIEFVVPARFPAALPRATETAGRIPVSFHHFDDGSLCLGAPIALRLGLSKSPDLVTYVDHFLVPYLFGYTYFQIHGELPFGELTHGAPGITEYICGLFGVNHSTDASMFLRLGSLRKRDANKIACPCGSGMRVGCCHNQEVNKLRNQHGRRWFRHEYSLMTGEAAKASRV